jgi:CDP-diacylglycerol--glycerol-3-phosphate 3-phosphatidyltransferase
MAISANEGLLGSPGASHPTIRSERFWNLPNSITMFRIGVVPVLLALPLASGKHGSQLIAWAFIVAAVTDVIDGWLARRGQQVTHIGKLLDPLADKLVVSTALIVLVGMGRIPAWACWMVVVIVGRELAVTGLRGIASAGGQVMGASWLGKSKTLCQNISIGALIFHYETLGLPAHAIGMTLLGASTALTLWSGYLYFEAYFRGRGGSGLAGGSQP